MSALLQERSHQELTVRSQRRFRVLLGAAVLAVFFTEAWLFAEQILDLLVDFLGRGSFQGVACQQGRDQALQLMRHPQVSVMDVLPV